MYNIGYELKIETLSGRHKSGPKRVSELAETQETCTFDPVSSDVALFLHISSTTAKPKGIPLFHGNLIARMNNISQHFVTAWLGKYVKGDESMSDFLDLVPNSNDSVWAIDKDGTVKPEHNHWKGFANRTAKGLRFETLKAGN